MSLLKPRYGFVLLVVLYAIVYIPAGELVNINHGLGWDGKFYAAMARSISFGGGVTGVVPEFRFLPSAIVHYALKATGYAFSNANIRLAFQVYDALLLVITVFAFGGVLEELGYSVKTQVFGLVCLTLNFCFLKWSFWYPILTDQSTICLATLMLYFYIKNDAFWLLIVALAGYFTNPALLLAGTLLLACPRDPMPTEPLPRRVVLAGRIALLLVFTGLFVWFYAINGDPGLRPRRTGVGAGVAIVYAAVGLAFLLDNKRLFSGSVLISRIKWDRLLFCGAFYFLFNILTTPSGTSNVPGQTIASIIQLLGLDLHKPFVTIAAMLAFYGPVVAVIVYSWSRFSQAGNRLGLGFQLVIVFGFLLVLVVRPRQFMAVYPFFVLCIAEVFSHDEWKWRYLSAFALASLILSRFWQPLNNLVREGVRAPFFMNYQVMHTDHYNMLVLIFIAVIVFCHYPVRGKRFRRRATA